MRVRYGFDAAAALLLLLVSFASPAEEWTLPADACGLAVTADGDVWTAHRAAWRQAYLLRHRGDESFRIDLPQSLSLPSDLVPDAEGGLWIVGSPAIGHLTRTGEVKLVAEINAAAGAVDAEGRLWVVTYSYPPRVHIVSLDGAISEIDAGASDPFLEIAIDRKGRAWLAGWREVRRIDRDGSVQSFAWHPYSRPWIAAGEGDTMVGAGGIIASDGSVDARPVIGEDGVVGADGRTWVARWRDLVVAIDNRGAEELYPAPGPRTGPWSDELSTRIAAGAQNDIWATAASSLRRIDVSEKAPDLAARRGDVVVLQQEPNCCFEGTHPVITRHRSGTQPYVLEFDASTLRGMLPQFTPDGRLVGITRRTISAEARTWTFADLSPTGNTTPVAEFTLTTDTAVHAFFVHPDREYWVLLRKYDRLSLRRLDDKGAPIAWIVLPEVLGPSTVPRAIDVAADRCTIGYFAAFDSVLRRFNICTDTDVRDIALATNGTATDFRFLRDGRVLVATEREVAVFDAAGSRQRTYDGVDAVAMDAIEGYFWAASASTVALRRIEFATGNAVEEIPLYARPDGISIDGEQRASSPASVPQSRRRAVQRN